MPHIHRRMVFFSNVSDNTNDDNSMSPILNPGGVPYKDSIPDADIFMRDK